MGIVCGFQKSGMKAWTSALIFILICFLSSCNKENPAPPTRSYRMGFENSAPSIDFNLFVQSLKMWTTRADAAMITTEVPWDSLLAGVSPQSYVNNNYSGIVNYYKGLNLKLWVYIDPANGLNRGTDANALVAVGKSISQPDVQLMYRRFVVVMDSMLKPDHLGLALETNLIRIASPAQIYQGIVKASNDAAADIKAFDKTVNLSISVQAEVAWGRLQGTFTYVGISQDITDFPFIQELGISSYPYFDFQKPQDIPDNYYSNIAGTLPVFVSEGGWSTQSIAGTKCLCSTQQQSDYINRQSLMLDNAKAIGYFQLTFTDIDVTKLPSNVDPTIKLFAYLGLVDIQFAPKPALSIWDSLFKRPLK